MTYTGWGFQGTWWGDPNLRPDETPRGLTLDDAPEEVAWVHVRRQLFWPIFKRDGGRCHWCGCEVSTHRKPSWLTLSRTHATLDHIVPVSKGGRDTLGNLVLACNGCNSERGNMSAKTFANRKARSI
jgi:5-methylcytosine-specific restriction endonuclease McrA